MRRSDLGSLGETIALDFLRKKGYSFLAKNYRKRWGEIDLILQKGETVHFVEVKTTSSKTGFSRENGNTPEELAHASKLKKVARTALLYMEEKRDRREFQIDVVTVRLNLETRTAKCHLYEQALGE